MYSTNTLEWKIWAPMNGVPGVVTVLLLYLVPSFAVDTFRLAGTRPRQRTVPRGLVLFRGAFFLLIFLGVPWNRLRYFIWGNITFALVLLLSTFVHADKFRFDLFTGWLWLFLYLEEPIWMVFLISRASRQPATASVQPVALLPAFKLFLFAQALVLIGGRRVPAVCAGDLRSAVAMELPHLGRDGSSPDGRLVSGYGRSCSRTWTTGMT